MKIVGTIPRQLREANEFVLDSTILCKMECDVRMPTKNKQKYFLAFPKSEKMTDNVQDAEFALEIAEGNLY